MAKPKKAHPAAGFALGGAMLAIVIAAALAPNAVSLPAQTSCQYGTCTSASGGVEGWQIALIAILVVAALALSILYLRHRSASQRRSPPPPVEETTVPEVPPGAGAAAMVGGAASLSGSPGVTPTPTPSGAGASYLETAGDVEIPPSLAPLPPPTPPPTTPGAEEDIDSLMAELDKISGDILKRGPPKKGEEKDLSGGSGGS